MIVLRTLGMGVFAAAVVCVASMPGMANTVIPYSTDANTIVLYHLDDSTGATTAIDASGNTLNLTANSSPFAGVAGPDGLSTAGSFPQTSGNYQLYRTPNATELALFPTNNFTVEAWVYEPTGTTGDHEGIFVYRNGNTDRLQFGVLGPATGGNNNKLLLAFNRDDTGAYYGNVLSPVLAWDPDTWYHVAATYDSNTAAANDSIVRFYRNEFGDASGVANLIATVTGVPDIEPLATGGQIRLGGFDSSATRSFGGLIDEVRLSNVIRDSFNLAIPEPSSVAMLAGLGLSVLFGTLWRRRRAA